MKKIIALLLAVVLAFSLCSCGGVKGSDARLVYPIDADPKFLDPQIISDTGARNIILNCFEGLVTLSDKGKIEKGMAESWSISPDGKVYTFKLRKNSRWRVTSAAKKVLGDNIELYPTYDKKGKLNTVDETKEKFLITVTAHDFEFGIKRALMPETKSPGAYKLFSVKNAREVHSGKLSADELGVKALDDFTLEITLQKTDGDFLYALLEPACMPCNKTFFERTGGRYGLATRYLLYNGPFYINNWADDTSVSISRNVDYYYDVSSVYPRSVYFSVNSDRENRVRKLKSDIYDVAPLSLSQGAEFENQRGYTVNKFQNSLFAMVLNTNNEYLKNLKIRQALSSAFPFDVVKSERDGKSPEGIFPKNLLLGSTSYGEKIKDNYLLKSSDPQSLLKKGLKEIEKKEISLTILCEEKDENLVRKIIQVYQSSLGISLNVSAESTDYATLKKRVDSSDFEIALTSIDFSGNNIADAAMKFTSESRTDPCSFKSKKYDSIVEEIVTISDTAKKSAKVFESEKYLINSACIIPLYFEDSLQIFSKGVSGVNFNISGDVLYFKNAVKK